MRRANQAQTTLILLDDNTTINSTGELPAANQSPLTIPPRLYLYLMLDEEVMTANDQQDGGSLTGALTQAMLQKAFNQVKQCLHQSLTMITTTTRANYL